MHTSYVLTKACMYMYTFFSSIFYTWRRFATGMLGGTALSACGRQLVRRRCSFNTGYSSRELETIVHPSRLTCCMCTAADGIIYGTKLMEDQPALCGKIAG